MMKNIWISIFTTVFIVSCEPTITMKDLEKKFGSQNDIDNSDDSDNAEIHDNGDTGNTGDTGDTGNTGDTAIDADGISDNDTGNTGDTSADTAETTDEDGDTGNTSDDTDKMPDDDPGICPAVSESKIICTGQTKCYDDTTEIGCPSAGKEYYGQDGYFASCGFCTEKNLTATGSDPEKVIIDSNNGLKWQGNEPLNYDGCSGGTPVGSKCTFPEAVSYCENLNYNGETGWRMPSIKELLTIIDYDKHSPAVDTDLFPDIPNEAYFWTTTERDEENLTILASIDGHYEQISKEAASSPGNSNYTICVKGEKLLEYSNFSESTINGKTIVSDSVSGFQWTKDQIVVNSWKGALSYCENLQYAGNDDWRLPNIYELLTLYDETKNEPATEFPFIDDFQVVFWSSTTSVKEPNVAWWIWLKTGVTGEEDKSSQYMYAICVR